MFGLLTLVGSVAPARAERMCDKTGVSDRGCWADHTGPNVTQAAVGPGVVCGLHPDTPSVDKIITGTIFCFKPKGGVSWDVVNIGGPSTSPTTNAVFPDNSAVKSLTISRNNTNTPGPITLFVLRENSNEVWGFNADTRFDSIDDFFAGTYPSLPKLPNYRIPPWDAAGNVLEFREITFVQEPIAGGATFTPRLLAVDDSNLLYQWNPTSNRWARLALGSTYRAFYGGGVGAILTVLSVPGQVLRGNQPSIGYRGATPALPVLPAGTVIPLPDGMGRSIDTPIALGVSAAYVINANGSVNSRLLRSAFSGGTWGSWQAMTLSNVFLLRSTGRDPLPWSVIDGELFRRTAGSYFLVGGAHHLYEYIP
ncbi:MAG: hypothetical protein QM756_34810 [Polyangiaceae bacterium]